jgi:hypothetical protein
MGGAEAADEVLGDAVRVAEVERLSEYVALTGAAVVHDHAPCAGVRLDLEQAAAGGKRPALADRDPAARDRRAPGSVRREVEDAPRWDANGQPSRATVFKLPLVPGADSALTAAVHP